MAVNLSRRLSFGLNWFEVWGSVGNENGSVSGKRLQDIHCLKTNLAAKGSATLCTLRFFGRFYHAGGVRCECTGVGTNSASYHTTIVLWRRPAGTVVGTYLSIGSDGSCQSKRSRVNPNTCHMALRPLVVFRALGQQSASNT